MFHAASVLLAEVVLPTHNAVKLSFHRLSPLGPSTPICIFDGRSLRASCLAISRSALSKPAGGLGMQKTESGQLLWLRAVHGSYILHR